MTPGQKEIAWLLGMDGDNKFAFTGKTSLQMTGAGPTNNYTLDGHWDLSEASYSYSDIFTKPQSQGNRLVFKSNFKTDKVQLESFSYQLASLTVNATGLYRIKDKQIPSFTINSNPFQIEDLSTNLPRIGEYQPRGQIRLALTGSGMPKSIADLRWRGNITFSDVSFKPFKTSKAISCLERLRQPREKQIGYITACRAYRRFPDTGQGNVDGLQESIRQRDRFFSPSRS